MNGTWATALQLVASILGVILAAYGHPVPGAALCAGAVCTSHERIGRWTGQ